MLQGMQAEMPTKIPDYQGICEMLQTVQVTSEKSLDAVLKRIDRQGDMEVVARRATGFLVLRWL